MFVAMLAPAAAQAATTSGGLLRAMNEARAAHGLGPLRQDRTLAKAALAHSRDMIRRDVLGHYGFVQRMQRAGVRGFVGENLAWGVGETASPSVIVQRWLDSPAHRFNLLHPRFRKVGLAVPVGAFGGAPAATVVTANFAG